MLWRRRAIGGQCLLAAALFAAGCAPKQPPQAPPSVAQRAPAPETPTPKPPPDAAVPAWIRNLLPSMRLPSAENVMDLADAPSVVVCADGVFFEGKPITDVNEKGRLQRIDSLFNELKQFREKWKVEHPGEDFHGVIQFWIDGNVSTDVVKSVFYTAGFAGYPNGSFVVHPRSQPQCFGRLNADARIPMPPSQATGGSGDGRSLPPEVIQRIVRENFAKFRTCYEAGLVRSPNLTGRFMVRFVIDRDGHVSSVADAGSDITNAEVIRCSLEAFKQLVFPKPEGGPMTVVYPIQFAPGD